MLKATIHVLILFVATITNIMATTIIPPASCGKDGAFVSMFITLYISVHYEVELLKITSWSRSFIYHIIYLYTSRL